MAKRREHWEPTDHACRECGGRVVRLIGHGPTGGGNPIWQCADCEIGSAAMGPECICWCGFRHRGQGDSAYRCVHVDRAQDDPAIAAALMRAGYLSLSRKTRPKTVIAVISEDTLGLCASAAAESIEGS